MNSKIKECQIKSILYPDINKTNNSLLNNDTKQAKQKEELNKIKNYIKTALMERKIKFYLYNLYLYIFINRKTI